MALAQPAPLARQQEKVECNLMLILKRDHAKNCVLVLVVLLHVFQGQRLFQGILFGVILIPWCSEVEKAKELHVMYKGLRENQGAG